MAKVRCEVSEGLRSSEVVAKVVDFSGRQHFIRVERDFLTFEADAPFLPIDIVHVDGKNKAALVEFPHEAETGANRVWVRFEQLDEPAEVFA